MTNQIVRFFLCAIIVIASLVTLPISVQHAGSTALTTGQKTVAPVPDRYQMSVAQTESLPKYVTKRGESSTKIGRKFNVDKKEVRRLNKLSPVTGKHGRNFYFLAPKTTIFLPALQLDGSPVKVNPAGFAIVTKKATKQNLVVASTRTQKERVEAKSKPVPVKPTVSSGVKKPKKQTAEQIAAADRLRRYHEQLRRDAQQAKRDATAAKNVPPVEMVTKEKFDALEKRNKELQSDLNKQVAEVKRLNELLNKNSQTIPATSVPIATVTVTPQRNTGKVAILFSLLLVGLCGFSGFLIREKTKEDDSLDESLTELNSAPRVAKASEWISKAKETAHEKFFEIHGREADYILIESRADVLVTGKIKLERSSEPVVRQKATELTFQAYQDCEGIGSHDRRDAEPIILYCLPNGTVMNLVGKSEVVYLSFDEKTGSWIEVVQEEITPADSQPVQTEVPADFATAQTKVFEESKNLGADGNRRTTIYVQPAPPTIIQDQAAPTVQELPKPPAPPRPMIVRPKEGAPTVPNLRAPETSPNNGTGKPANTQVYVHPDVR